MAEVRVLWSNRARSDLEEIVSYIAQDSPMAARNVATKIVEAVSMLERFPTVGRIVPEFGDHKLREILYRNYRIVYRISESSATVVAVFHGSRPLA